MAVVLIPPQVGWSNGPGYLSIRDAHLGSYAWGRKPLGAIRARLVPLPHGRRREAIAVYVEEHVAGWIPDSTSMRIHELIAALVELGHEVQVDVWNRPGHDQTLIAGYPSFIEKHLALALDDLEMSFLDAPNCPQCLEPMEPVVGAWWCPSCRVQTTPE